MSRHIVLGVILGCIGTIAMVTLSGGTQPQPHDETTLILAESIMRLGDDVKLSRSSIDMVIRGTISWNANDALAKSTALSAEINPVRCEVRLSRVIPEFNHGSDNYKDALVSSLTANSIEIRVPTTAGTGKRHVAYEIIQYKP